MQPWFKLNYLKTDNRLQIYMNYNVSFLFYILSVFLLVVFLFQWDQHTELLVLLVAGRPQ